MNREKRSLIRKTVNFAPSTWEQLEMFMAQENVRSIFAAQDPAGAGDN